MYFQLHRGLAPPTSTLFNVVCGVCCVCMFVMNLWIGRSESWCLLGKFWLTYPYGFIKYIHVYL